MASRTSYRISTPAPSGGWNTRDDVSSMPAQDAEVLDNWLPDVNSVKPRKGYEQYASGVGAGDVHTLTPYVTSSGTEKFIAAGGTSIYDITSGTTLLATGVSPEPWDTSNFNNRLILCNGSGVREYDGTSITDASFSDDIAGKFFASHVFKNRMYYAARDELAFWYTELFASTGTITKFPLAGIAERGGSVVGINSWTADGGSGPDDFLAVFTSEGEVLIYQGTDPGADFFIIGRFYIGRIVDNLAISQIYGRLLVVTDRDYIYLPDQLATQGGGKDTKLSGAARDAVKLHKNKSGWKTYYSASEGLAIINVPTGSGVSEQHVLNVKTGAATRFTGINARSWNEYKGNLYFGGVDGTVNKYTGTKDGSAAIPCTALAAPTRTARGAEGMVTAYRSRLTSDGDLTLSTQLRFDLGAMNTSFNFSAGRTANLQTQTIQSDQSYVLPLDWPFSWPDAFISPARTEWFRGTGRGTFVQLFLETNVKNTAVSWFGNEFIVESGGILR